MRRLTLLGTCLIVTLFSLGIVLVNTLVSRTLPSWPYLLVAMFSGLAGGYVLWREVLQPIQGKEEETAVRQQTIELLQLEVADLHQKSLALRQEKEQYRDLVEQANDIIFVLDLDGVFVYINEAVHKVAGYDPQELVGQHFNRIAPRANEERLWQYLQQDGIANYEFEFDTKDDRLLVMEINGRLVRKPGQEPAILGIARDITDKKQQKVELEQAKNLAEKATQAKTVFLANMGHELRTPLSVIIGYADIIGQDALASGKDDYRQLAQKIKQAAQQLRNIVNDILEITEIETDQVTFLLETFDIAELVRRTVNQVQTAVEANNNELMVLTPPDIGEMFADQAKVGRALENLLSNAAKFTQDGSITLGVNREFAEEREWIIFRVTDTGIGIAPDQHEKIFLAFEQVDKSFTRGYGGTGLGLAINQHICQAMEGKISFVSELGMGTTFTMRLPARVTAVDSMFVRKQ
ncbi:MAG: PAS domain S-box protein [Anaerolineales bacterium]|nr:PAS domain S-box protein [Anaerolineales bacterium]